MGRHKKWRAEVKKLRRKRIRTKLAIQRDDEQARRELSPTYQVWINQQTALELIAEQEEERLSVERHKKYLEVEAQAQKRWLELQEKLKRAQKEKEEQEIRVREEWRIIEQEARKRKEEKQKEEEEKRKKEEELLIEIDNFIAYGGTTPLSLLGSTGQRPLCEECPFYAKTGACRFGERCSRNHVIPGLSTIIMIPGFYSHFGLEQALTAEFDPDLMLEYEERDRENHFRLFFNDIVPELETYGKILTLRVCCNAESHLRGNVYIEYEQERFALKAFRGLTGRWYAGRQLQPKFIKFRGWKEALCGLHFRRDCPKGATCNFLHVFRNPGNAFDFRDRERAKAREIEQREREHDRSWRWDSDNSDEEIIYVNKSERRKHRDSKRTSNSHRQHSHHHERERKRSTNSSRKRHKRQRSSSSRSSSDSRSPSNSSHRNKRTKVMKYEKSQYSDKKINSKKKNKSKDIL